MNSAVTTCIDRPCFQQAQQKSQAVSPHPGLEESKKDVETKE
jgi:hypothetical protein